VRMDPCFAHFTSTGVRVNADAARTKSSVSKCTPTLSQS